MKTVIRLKDFIQEMEIIGDEIKAFLNIRTGEFILFSEEELSAAEEGKSAELFSMDTEMTQKALDVLQGGDYKAMPDKFDIHEYAIMERFCYSVEDGDLRNRLVDAIRGSGAFRRFKDLVFEQGVREDWFTYRYQAFKEIAIDWLEHHGITYIDEKA